MSRIVVITGASSGYGKATAKAFKNNGDIVIMTARNEEKLKNIKGCIKACQRRHFRILIKALVARFIIKCDFAVEIKEFHKKFPTGKQNTAYNTDNRQRNNGLRLYTDGKYFTYFTHHILSSLTLPYRLQ